MKAANLSADLLAWYDAHKRELPWRGRPTPYETLLSELMLQQTVVATVIPYFQRFRRQFPTVQALAAAPEDAVMKAWAGLGYYARARNLQRAAQAIVSDHGGVVPADEQALRALPGVGEYTAAAVAAIAFGLHTFALDGNAARVMARLGAEPEAIDRPATRVRLRAFGQTLVPAARPGDFAQAVMELGARVCVPRNPRCDECPIARPCRARALGLAANLPVRTPRAEKKPMRMLAVAAERGRGWLLVRRPAGGLLAGTWSLPLVECTVSEATPAALAALALRETGVRLLRPRAVAGEVRHVFTHLDVTAHVIAGAARGRLRAGTEAGFFTSDELPALSSFSRKILALLG